MSREISPNHLKRRIGKLTRRLLSLGSGRDQARRRAERQVARELAGEGQSRLRSSADAENNGSR